MLRTLKQILPEDVHGRVMRELMDQKVLNAGLIAGKAGVLAVFWLDVLRLLKQGPGCKNNWISAQAAMNVYAHQNPLRVRPLDPQWCFDLRWYKYQVTETGEFRTKDGKLIPVVHAAGHQAPALGGFAKKQYNSLARKAEGATA